MLDYSSFLYQICIHVVLSQFSDTDNLQKRGSLRCRIQMVTVQKHRWHDNEMIIALPLHVSASEEIFLDML